MPAKLIVQSKSSLDAGNSVIVSSIEVKYIAAGGFFSKSGEGDSDCFVERICVAELNNLMLPIIRFQCIRDEEKNSLQGNFRFDIDD